MIQPNETPPYGPTSVIQVNGSTKGSTCSLCWKSFW